MALMWLQSRYIYDIISLEGIFVNPIPHAMQMLLLYHSDFLRTADLGCYSWLAASGEWSPGVFAFQAACVGASQA